MRRPVQKLKLWSGLTRVASEFSSRALLKADAVAADLCDYFERMKMRLAEIAAVRLTGAHGQIIFEEKNLGGIGRRR
jgi:hypothetical protein